MAEPRDAQLRPRDPLAARLRDHEQSGSFSAAGSSGIGSSTEPACAIASCLDAQAGGRTPIVQVPYLMESFLFDYGSDAAPRVMVVSKTEVVGDTGQQIETLFTGGWDIRSTAIIEHEPAAAGDAGPPVAPSATITTDTANRVVVEAGVGAAGGYLVLLDSFSDDWRATADGRPATIVRANGLFRAVRLNPGSHVVEFRLSPAGISGRGGRLGCRTGHAWARRLAGTGEAGWSRPGSTIPLPYALCRLPSGWHLFQQPAASCLLPPASCLLPPPSTSGRGSSPA